MFSFVYLLRTVYSFARNGQLEPISILNALLSKEPYNELIKLLLNRYLESPSSLYPVLDVNCQNAHGWTVAHFAAYYKNVQLMQTCIQNDADLMITDCSGNTVLHIVIQVAQKTKSTAHCWNQQQQSSQHQCLTIDINQSDTIEPDDQEYLQIVQLILNRSNCETDLNTDCSQINLIDRQNDFGKTPLHYACFLKPDKYSIRLISMLMHAKANADIADFRDCTPLYYLLAEHRSKNYPKKCTKNCIHQRSPFIELLTSYKCDRLNLDELDCGITSLQQLCRKTIQTLSPKLQSFYILKNGNKTRLPLSLCNYLSRRTL